MDHGAQAGLANIGLSRYSRVMSGTPSSFLAAFYVAVGGGAGALARYRLGLAMQVDGALNDKMAFPWPTLTVNVLGSLIMGLLTGWLAYQGAGAKVETARLLLGVGLLGGFTTFSAFSLETIVLLERAAVATACLYVGTSVLAGIAALFLGLNVMRSLA